ncbi:tRNA-dihydrouridine synthase [Spirochaetia bacterium]|nr:tRNA-dihydrouridine synthase [Spirochaetia bacterium]GHU31767.1 tRNA-dihydrouridine synthase [Spirochaetia bacterium]
MAEISHRALRELIESFGGCDEYFSEMINASTLMSNGPFEKWYTDAGPCPEKVVFQIVGTDPVRIADAAGRLDQLPCRGIDLNMGCPAPAIVRTGAGIRWMESIDRAGALIARVRPAVSHRLSVKLRIGLTDDFDYLLRFCRRLAAEGVDLITLHPRTAKEKLKRSPRWNYVTHLRAELPIPVAGNGDIANVPELLLRSGQCDAVMIGRGAVRQPWIFAQARHGTIPELNGQSISLQFLDLLELYQPPEFFLSRARRFFAFFCGNFTWAHYLNTLINRENDHAGIIRVLSTYFHENPEEMLIP